MAKARILVIDDEKNITSLLKTYLESAGSYEVRAENSGQKGYEAVADFKPDLVLLDIMMEGMTGDAFAMKLKADPAYRKTPIVFLTGIVTKEEVQAQGGVIAGYPYLAKPIMVEELLDCIQVNLRK
jgi:CheY-like chemotaxis protein